MASVWICRSLDEFDPYIVAAKALRQAAAERIASELNLSHGYENSEKHFADLEVTGEPEKIAEFLKRMSDYGYSGLVVDTDGAEECDKVKRFLDKVDPEHRADPEFA